MRAWIMAAGAIFVIACSARQITPVDDPLSQRAYQDRRLGLTAITAWNLSGKLSLDDGHDGGSGKLVWQVRPGFDQMDFRGALGKGAWRLQIDEHEAVLQKADGSISRADNVRDLVLDEVGWGIPVDSLRWWVLGLSAPGPVLKLDLNADGHLLALQQDGWEISFDRYRAFGDIDLPGKLVATQNQRRVKLAVLDWAVTIQDE